MATSETQADIAEHLKRLQSVTDAALAHLSVESLLDELLSRIRELLHADTAAVLLLDEQTAELVATAAKGLEEEVEQGVRLPVGGGFAGRIAATGEPVILAEVDHRKVLNPLLLAKGIRSMLGVPLIVGGRVVGVLHVGTLTPRDFTTEDVELMQLVADRVAMAVHIRREHSQRVLAETLQRSLLPDRFPKVHGVEISGHYQPGDGGIVGGDWFDVFVVGAESLCVVVGDIAGRGVPAAIAMGRLRNAVRALVFVNGKPDLSVSQLNDFLLHFDPGIMATVLVGLLEADGTMKYASAGHLPPVYVDSLGRAHLIEEPAEPPLGGVDFMSYRERTLRLEPGSTLLLYTDGLVERRGRPLEEGLEALRAASEKPWANLDSLCGDLFGEQAPALADDVAVLALRLAGVDRLEEIHTSITADPRELGPLRRTLRRWLAASGADPQQTQDVLVAVGEAVSNSIEHAHAPGNGSIRVDAVRQDVTLVISVSDRGSWREPRGTNRGLGRSLMRKLMDEVDYVTDEHGTSVTMRKQLRFPT
jgi:anti-sigma regulatory factor (Ser/Thr protein kinase)/putative methionine-R-sulfoxide reductase with GAF domain